MKKLTNVFKRIFGVIKDFSKKSCATLIKKIKGFIPFIKSLSKKQKIIILVSALLLVAASILAYFLTRPRYYVEGYVTPPGISNVYSGQIYPSGFNLSFPAPVAKLDLVGKEIEKGVSIFPNVAGKWYWTSQEIISFSAEKDWAPNTTYTITVNKSIFDDTYTIKPLEYKFTTPPFSANISSTEFYEDPIKTKIKRVTSTLSFSHPVELSSIEKNLKITTTSGEKYGFTLTPENANRLVYVVSDPIKIKSEEDFLTISLNKAQNIYNKENIIDEVKSKITIPSSSTFFKINNVFSNIVYNQEKENEAEQILFIDFSTAVAPESLAQYINLYQYKGYCGDFHNALNKQKKQDYEITKVKGISKLDYQTLPVDQSNTKLHSFKYDIKDPKKICVIAEIKRGLISQDGFTFNKTSVKSTSASIFPTEAKISFDGSLLSFTGDKRLSILTRGIEKVTANISRIPAENVNHLISQTYGSFSRPYFSNYNFTANNISQNFEETIPLNVEHPAKANYASVNLNKYFANKKGIFIASIKGYRKGENHSSSSDDRLVLVTNLGIIAKDNVDKTHDVFISDFANQKPVRGARVDILGLNGIPVLTEYTDGAGKVTFPDFSDFKNEKKPVAYIVSTVDDFSYLPIGRSDRRLDYSHFDVEGEYISSNNENLKAYVFSDRGIYRPGEEAFFGMIIRDQELNIPRKNAIKVVITDSYGDEVLERKMDVNNLGFLDLSYNINALARTGYYNINVSVLKNKYYTNIGYTSFKVEEFAPDTMKIKSKILGDTTKGWINKEKLEANVTLENLYGNPASKHDIHAEFDLMPTNFYFTKYENYHFNDPLRKKTNNTTSINEKLESEVSDKNGQANFSLDLSQYAKGTYRLLFRVQGMELEGGRSVHAQSSVLVSPLEHLVGYKKDGDFGYISKDSERLVEFIAINPDLNKIKLDNLTMKLFERKYVSTLVKQPNGTFKYQSVEKVEEVKSSKITINEKSFKHNLDTSKPGTFYIDILDKDENVLSRVDYFIAGAKNLSYSLDKNAELLLKLNKKQYNHGDDIEMQITAPYTGYGLITIEKDKVYEYRWFKADTLSSTQTINLPSNVEGNAYINVAFIRDMDSKEIFMSPLSYAVIPFSINKEKRTINIELDTPTVVKPGEDLVIKYKASRKGKIILYGVNEGILQFARYKMPDPLTTFMPKQSLRVDTLQIMDLILPDANLINNLRSSGGDTYEQDAIAKNLNPFARKVDKPVAFWSGIIDVEKDDNTYTYNVPDNFNGQIRVMAVSVDEQAYGVAQKTTLVRGDFALTPSAPFNVTPNDVFEVGSSVANMVENSKHLKGKLSLSVSDNLEIIGSSQEDFSLDENAETGFKFKIKAKESLGNAKLTFTALSGDYKSTMNITLSIRPAMAYTTIIEANHAKKSADFKDFIINMYKEQRKQEIIASTSPMVLVRGMVKYLDKYPHGCTEQTVSRAFPMIALLFSHPELAEGVDPYSVFDIAISTLKQRQNSNGGFTAWLYNGASVDDFASIYAYHFLTFAQERDFDVPTNMMDRAKDYAKEIAGSTPNSLYDSTNIAYAIYTLTLNGEVTTNYLINLETTLNDNYKKEWKKSLAASYIASSYKLLQNNEKAEEIVGYYKLTNDSVEDSRHIYLMAKHFPKEFSKVQEKGLEIILKPLKAGYFNSIQSSYAILALDAYPSSAEDDKKISFSSGKADYTKFAHLDLTTVDSKEKLRITSKKPFYYVVNQQGFERNLPKKAISDGVEVIKEILNSKGDVITSAKLGDEVTIRIRAKAKGRNYVNDVAIVDLVPGCFETIATSVNPNVSFDNYEIREDRGIFYLGLSEQMTEITYKAKIIAKGEFIIPPVFASALYDAEIKANNKAGTIKINE